MGQLFAALIENFFIPELMRFVREHFAATGEIPTDASVKAALDAHADKVIADGTAFIASKQPPG